MGKQAANTIVIIGCGNVAWHIAKQLRSLKYTVTVYNHRSNKALKEFASVLGCETKTGLEHIIPHARFYFVCVTDSAITKVSKKINSSRPGAIVMHTSGSSEISRLENKGGHRAVFYPLQTFSKSDQLNWKNVPLILEAESRAVKASLSSLASQFTKNISFFDQKERLKLHLAAVLVNNFTNALYAAAFDLISKRPKDRGFELLLPLIRQTTAKLDRLAPVEAQTGPAKRDDKPVMKKHLQLLRKHKDLEKVYRQLSRLIIKQQSHA